MGEVKIVPNPGAGAGGRGGGENKDWNKDEWTSKMLVKCCFAIWVLAAQVGLVCESSYICIHNVNFHIIMLCIIFLCICVCIMLY